MIIAALWIVFLIGFVTGCAWANAVNTPAPRKPIPNGDCGHACEFVAPYGFVPEADCPVHDPPKPRMSERSLVKAIANRHNTDLAARN